MSTQDGIVADGALAGLKDFQRATVDYVHNRLWGEAPTHRFLVADEVGLGKTLVARGVIARTVAHLRAAGKSRIDVVYVCSNAQIARQNLGRLNKVGGRNIEHADRLTMLPAVLHELEDESSVGGHVNFISFTPGTSFQLSKSGGRARERALLYWLLAECWGRAAMKPTSWSRFFAGGSGEEAFKWELDNFDRSSLHADFTSVFETELAIATAESGTPLSEALSESAARFKWLRGKPTWQLSHERYQLIGELRQLVARCAVAALKPDLVILDEFQRFKDLLDPEAPNAELAQALFAQQTARVLLLSATPYKMYTLPDEPDGDDHYRDFVATYRFLAGPDHAHALERQLLLLRDALLGLRDRATGEQTRDNIERQLRRVMCRTERTMSLRGDDGMVEEKTLAGVEIGSADLRTYLDYEAVARAMDAPADLLEYWRSSPYLLNFMDSRSYQLKRKLTERADRHDPVLARTIGDAGGLLRRDEVLKYRALDYGNAKMRALVRDVIDREVWRLPWLPPSLPSWSLSGAFADPAIAGFTKRLVFSSWAVVPKAIGVVLSYEAERRLNLMASRWQQRYDDTRQTALLTFATSEGRRTGMPVVGLLYPSPTLAYIGDPLRLAKQEQLNLPIDRDQLLELATRQVKELLNRLPDEATDASPTGPDQRWYWAAPLVLDGQTVDDQDRFLTAWQRWSGAEREDAGQLAEHLQSATNISPPLGRRPDDLPDVIARAALASPATVALRALARVCGGESALYDPDIRASAVTVAWGLRTLFNRPEIITMLRSHEAGDAYWRTVIGMCLDGCLSAVLDEYAHVLVESEGLQSAPPANRAQGLATAMSEALSLRGANYTVDEVSASADQVQITANRMRVHLALRFGRDESVDGAILREISQRAAFNSPFWPFVLATTSVGQEGLDFHTYSSAVIHWNLPSNPVDLEQREGRVHRYKGHAVRRNVASVYKDRLTHTRDDVWEELFELAEKDRRRDENDLVPYWVFAPPGGARIERYIPAVPLSREVTKRRRLLRTTAAYRLVLGQPRQEDLVSYLDDVEAAKWARIDLRPTS